MRLFDLMDRGDVIICSDPEELSRKAADKFSRISTQAIESAGRFAVVLSGGSTPIALYARLAAEYRERIAWPEVHIFWGDERCVPPDHPESNYRMASEILLSRVPVPRESVHRIAGEKEPERAASEYEQTLREFFSLSGDGNPRFDLILLGLGEDGHTASLFPGSAVLRETKRLVAATYVQKLNGHRITLTLPVLNSAAEVIFLAAGRSKAAVLRDLLEQKSDELPAGKIKPLGGALTWLVDREAAGLLRYAQGPG